MEAGGRRADPGHPGQFPGRQRTVGQQRPQDRGPGRVGHQRRGRRDVRVVRVLGYRGHDSTLAQLSFNEHRRMTDNPARLVAEGVEKSLSIAMTWHAWDGRPIAGTVDGRPNVWTPAKALRRITEPDFSEASSRLRRLARTYLLTYEMAGEEAWD